MSQLSNIKRPVWKSIQDITAARRAVDFGVLLKWSDARHVVKILNGEQLNQLVRHVVVRMAERLEDRLATEILIETVLIVLATANQEALIMEFLQEMLDSQDFAALARVFVEVSLSAEVGDHPSEQAAMSTAVALICEIGLNVQRLRDEHPDELDRADALLDHVATYLLSVSNTNIGSVRLSLLRYFSHAEYGDPTKTGFNRLMNRFGHTLFDTLFQQLFHKKSEAVALQFLLENLPCALEAQGDSQFILHETFKQYMLKNPERFSLFLHTLGDQSRALSPEGGMCLAAESYFKHLVALFKVTADLNHKSLGREVLTELFKFEDLPGCREVLKVVETSSEIRRNFRELVTVHRTEISGKAKVVVSSQFRLSKRGRKPSLNKNGDFGFLEQVLTLGQYELQRSA